MALSVLWIAQPECVCIFCIIPKGWGLSQFLWPRVDMLLFIMSDKPDKVTQGHWQLGSMGVGQ